MRPFSEARGDSFWVFGDRIERASGGDPHAGWVMQHLTDSDVLRYFEFTAAELIKIKSGEWVEWDWGEWYQRLRGKDAAKISVYNNQAKVEVYPLSDKMLRLSQSVLDPYEQNLRAVTVDNWDGSNPQVYSGGAFLNAKSVYQLQNSQTLQRMNL